MNTEGVTADEIQRVALYWQRLEALTCQHPTVTYMSGEPPTCAACARPVRILSDIQVDNLRGHPGEGS